MKRNRARIVSADIAECALFTALMIAGAYISIPFPFVPLTFQTVFATLAGLLMGWKKGMLSTAAYMILGLAGVPVFTSGGGFSYVLKPSFGFVVGFVAAAVTGGIFFGGSKKLWHFIVLSLCACAVNYVIGGAFIYVWLIVNGSQDIASSMVNWVFVFIPKDIVLAVFAAIVAWKVKPVIVRMRQKYVRRDEIGSSDAQNQVCTSEKGGGFQSDIKDKHSK